MLKVNNVSYHIRGVQILKDINLELEPGEFLVIIGPNGAGKSTLLNCISGELKPENGNITLNGISLNAFNAKQLAQQRAILSQKINISMPYLVEEIVEMGRFPYLSSQAIDSQIVTKCLEKAGVTHLRKRPVQQLSGGEQQRVHLARVLAQLAGTNGERYKDDSNSLSFGEGRGEALLLLDEPTSSLDIRFQQEVLDIAKSISSKKCGVIAVLHDLNLAMAFADKVLLLNKGKIAAFGKTEDVMREEILSEVYEYPIRMNFDHDLNQWHIFPVNHSKTMIKQDLHLQ